VTKERQYRVLVNTEIDGDRRILTYQDQEREKRISYDDQSVTYSEWKPVKSWTDVRTTTSRTETQTQCVCEERKTNRRLEAGPRPYLGGLLGNRPLYEVDEGETLIRTMAVMERTICTDFDGNESYGDWKTVRTYTE
jgi:hypothetical protein